MWKIGETKWKGIFPVGTTFINDSYFIEIKGTLPKTISLNYENGQARRYIDVLSTSPASTKGRGLPVLKYFTIDGVSIGNDVYDYARWKGVTVIHKKFYLQGQGEIPEIVIEYLKGPLD